MRVLVDECAPSALKIFLAEHGHDSQTVQESGWRGKQYGELLNLADANFDVLVTLDTNLKYQQNFSGRKIALAVIVAPSNRLIHLRPLFPALIETLKTIKSGEIVYLENKL